MEKTNYLNRYQNLAKANGHKPLTLEELEEKYANGGTESVESANNQTVVTTGKLSDQTHRFPNAVPTSTPFAKKAGERARWRRDQIG